MHVQNIFVKNFRNYDEVNLQFSEGVTAIVGKNGHGKSNILEALFFLASAKSFRAGSRDVLIKDGQDQAIVRGEGIRIKRSLLIECEINRVGRDKFLFNKQVVSKAQDRFGGFSVTIFTPDDLVLIKGGPSYRRDYLDEILCSSSPKYVDLIGKVEAILRQRNALLKQARGVLSVDIAATLDVWDEKFSVAGERLIQARRAVLEEIFPIFVSTYENISQQKSEISLTYAPSTEESLSLCLENNRQEEIRRGTTLFGPHRDDVVIHLNGFPSRTHASQGEQRCLAFSMRLAAHKTVAKIIQCNPILLLDDIFSELDPVRSALLIKNLPTGQTILTTASELPDGIYPEKLFRVEHARVSTE